MANPHAIGNAFHITTDESMTWNQIYQTIADALGKPLNALHVASDFLARHGENYDFRGEQYMLSHPETQTPDPEFDSWCDRIADAMCAADRAFESK